MSKMNHIYSEKELLPPGLSLGQWEFTLSNTEINEKLESLSKSDDVLAQEDVCWKTLLSLVTHEEDLKTNNESSKSDSIVRVIEDVPMKCSIDKELEGEQQIESGVSLSDIEDIIVSLVEKCNQIAKTLKPGCYCGEEELAGVVEDLQKLNEPVLTKVVDKAWSQLNSDASKMCFCVAFCVKSDWCEILCKQALVPWFSKSLPSKLEQFSKIFSKQGDVFCKHFLAPLLQKDDSPFVKDPLSLEEILTAMPKKNWAILLKDLLSGLDELYSWIIPVLAVVLEHSDPSLDELGVLIQRMSSTGSNFSKNRDFGALLVAVAMCMKPSVSAVVPQIKLIANNYKGPLKFKVLKILNDIKG